MITPKILSIILSYNSRDYIAGCIESLRSSSEPTDILVVDNKSHDGTADYVRSSFPEVRVHQTGANLGYAGGNNAGLKLALDEGYEFAFVVNPDLTVESNCLEQLVHVEARHPQAALISPKVYYAGHQQRQLWFAGAMIDWQIGQTPHFGWQETDVGQYDEERSVDRACGAAMLVALAAARSVGLMDDRYFLYFEETDWSVQFGRSGYEIWYAPGAVCWHQVSSATGGEDSPLCWYYMTRNNLLFMSKFATAEQSRSFKQFLRGESRGHIRRWMRRPSYLNWRRIRGVVQGYSDFYLKRFGRRFE